MRALSASFVVALLATAPALAQDPPIQVMSSGRVVAAGSTFNQPAGMEGSGATVAFFSQQPDRFSIKNMSNAPVTVQRVTLTPAEDATGEVFSLWTADIKKKPFDLQDQTLAPGATLDFVVRFFPVRAGPRRAKVTITYDGGKEFAFDVQGVGHPAEANFLTAARPSQHLLLGGAQTDALVTGMVVDGSGAAYLLWNEAGLPDKFSRDIHLARVNADGTRAWSKVWNGKFMDQSPDPGQNAESGGAAGAIAIDAEGFIYVVGVTSPSNSNSNFAALVMKVAPADGSIVWEQLWRPEWPKSLLAKHNAQAYGVDVAGGRVFVTGTTGAGVDQGESRVLLLALDAADGALKAQTTIDVHPTINDRGYCVRADGQGNLYLAGNGNANGIVLKLTDAAAEPKLAWAKTIDLGRGGNVNDLSLDAEGNLYLACDRRGAITHVSVVKLSPDGGLVWGKTIPGNEGTNNTVHVVRVVGDQVWVGGKLGLAPFDGQKGDGLVARLSAADGSLGWTGVYFTGMGPDEICEHRVKGLHVAGDTLMVMGQVYSGNMNGVRYHGYWYDAGRPLEDFAPALADVAIPEAQVVVPAKGALQSATEARTYGDAPAALVLQEATAKKDGKAPDGDVFLMRLQLSQQ